MGSLPSVLSRSRALFALPALLASLAAGCAAPSAATPLAAIPPGSWGTSPQRPAEISALTHASAETGDLQPVFAGHAPAAHSAEDAAHDRDWWTSRVIDPITAPYLFESPIIESNIRPIYIRHFFPKTGVFGGGRVDIAALQLRWAVTERLAIIAVKDGYADFQPHAGQDETGSVNIAGGFKYALIDDRTHGRLLTAGLTFENDNGDTGVLQGGSSGVWRPFLSGALEGEVTDFVASIGASLPEDGHDHSQSIDWHLHWSWTHEDLGDVRPLVEINGIHYTNNGRTAPLDVEGLDYANLGSMDVEGKNWITGAIGCRFRAASNTDLGVAYERPLTSRDDIFDDRLTFDAIIRF